MITTTDRPAALWVVAHRTLLVLVTMTVLLVAAVLMTLTALGGEQPAAVSTVLPDLASVDNGCAEARPGTPC